MHNESANVVKEEIQMAQLKVSSNGSKGVQPKLTVTYADQLDLEESVLNVSSVANESDVSEYCSSQAEHQRKPSKKDVKKKVFCPLEVIEECSVENSLADELGHKKAK